MGDIAKHGDPTTTGGQVFARDTTQTNGGIPLLLDGDKATCGKCPGTWFVIGTCEFMTFNGRKAVQYGDLITCPCGRNRVIATSTNMHYSRPGDASAYAAASISSAPSVNASSTAFDRAFIIKNNQTGKPLPMARYRLTLPDGTTVEGITDRMGMTQRIASASQQTVRIEVYL